MFFLVGIISFLFGIIFLKIFYKELELDLILANSLSFILVSGINFFLSIKFVFLRGKYSLKKEVVLFYVVAGSSLILDNLILYILVEKINIYYILSKICSVFIVSILSFILKKYLVFKK
ncbi:MAG: hypothetical protein GQ534_09880 [Candidatus Delongbacteria bacterium]|nr:hypothetical protein [Candidatus Delongbacteria bacterium]